MDPNHKPDHGGSVGPQDNYVNTVVDVTESMLDGRMGTMEQLLTAQRVQDIASIFRNTIINPHHDFVGDINARHSGLWGAPDAYRAAATWMTVVGPERYVTYLHDINAHHSLQRQAMINLGTNTNVWFQQNSYLVRQPRPLPSHAQHFATAAQSVADSASPGSSLASAQQLPVADPGVAGHQVQQGQFSPVPVDPTALVKQWMSLEGNQYRGLISNFAQYKQVRDAYLKLKDDETGNEVVEMPENELWVKARVKRLYEAILDTTDVIDNARLKAPSKKRKINDRESEEDEAEQGPAFVEPVAVARVRTLKSVEIEMLCYDVVKHAWYCQQGQYAMPAYTDGRVAGKPTKKLKAALYESLDLRLARCEEALKSSKNCTKQMLVVDFAQRLAYNPDVEIKRKKDNKNVNQKRDLENRAGKFAKASGLVVFNEADRSITAADGQVVAPAHPMTAKMMEGSNQNIEDHQDIEGDEIGATEEEKPNMTETDISGLSATPGYNSGHARGRGYQEYWH